MRVILSNAVRAWHDDDYVEHTSHDREHGAGCQSNKSPKLVVVLTDGATDLFCAFAVVAQAVLCRKSEEERSSLTRLRMHRGRQA